MMTRTLSFAAAALTLALAACGGGKAGEEFVGKMSKLRDEACACKDAACADGIRKKMNDLENELEKKFKSEKDVDKGVMEKLGKLDDEIKECRNKARGAEPAAPAAPATP